VKGTGLHALGTEFREPMSHFTGRPGGEGYGQTASWIMLSGEHPIGNAVRDRPGLSSSGTSQNNNRSRQS
jgi:hypothetical protein